MADINYIKLSGTVYTIVDDTALHTLDSTVTSDGANAVKGSGIYNAITASTAAVAEAVAEQMSGKTDTSAFTAHTSDATIHVTSEEKANWNSVSGYADSVIYNSTSKYVEFYHGGTGGTKVFEYDASPFLIDGMVQNVEIKDVEISGETVTCLVISFNTDAGKQDINIPLTNIFDASNYYDKNAIDGIVSGINQDISTVSGTVTTHTGDTTIHVTLTDKTTWSGKQDALVSGTNIKTINGTSLLGSGDLQVQSLPTVSGTTLIFS